MLSRYEQSTHLIYIPSLFSCISNVYIVATSPLALCWMCDSPRTGCSRRTILIYMWHKQAITQWSRRIISVVACCHSVKLCALAARAFRSQQYTCTVLLLNLGRKLRSWKAASAREWDFTAQMVWRRYSAVARLRGNAASDSFVHFVTPLSFARSRL